MTRFYDHEPAFDDAQRPWSWGLEDFSVSSSFRDRDHGWSLSSGIRSLSRTRTVGNLYESTQGTREMAGGVGTWTGTDIGFERLEECIPVSKSRLSRVAEHAVRLDWTSHDTASGIF
jgi:hypothetical protein